MVWRYPAKSKCEEAPVPWSAELTDDMMNQVHKRLCQSTYQTDYLGIPQGILSRFMVMVFNATFNYISVILWWSVLLVEETGENHRLATSR